MARERADLSRLAALQDELGLELPEIVGTLITELDRALRRARRALSAGDLAAVALAAHAARSSALMLEARAMLEGLDELERSARTGDAPGAAEALDRLAATWPPLRGALRAAPAGRA